MTSVFNAYSTYYDLLYHDKDYAAEAAYIDGLLKHYGKEVSELLEFGSGTGIHARLLTEKNYKVTGIELSQTMVDKAEKIEGFTCIQGDIRSTNLGRNFDAVISLFHVMSYQIKNLDIQNTFANAAAHLTSGGLFVFDFWYSPAVYAQKPEVRIKRLENKKIKITRTAEPAIYPNENRVDVHYTIHAQEALTNEYHMFEEVHPMRHFSLPEIDFQADVAGFDKVGEEAFLTGEKPGEDTWSVCVVMRKI